MPDRPDSLDAPDVPALRAWLDATPGLVHGGRLLACDDPERVGWPEVERLARQEGLLALLMTPLDAVERVRARLGEGWHLHRWSVYVGEGGQVAPICRRIVAEVNLPEDFALDAVPGDADDAVFEEIAALDRAAGVSPQPTWYLRGKLLPSLTTVLRDDSGRAIATGSAQARHHPSGIHAGWIFVGAVAVHPEQRGRGFGRLMNAFTVQEALERLPGDTVYEHVAVDNAPSRAMVRRCGLHEDAGRVALAISRAATSFTR